MKITILCVSACFIMIMAAGYALLPWWLPKEKIRRQILAGIKQGFARQAEIDHIDISWNRGIEIRGLRIARDKNFGQGYLLQAAVVVLPFSPGELMRGQISRLECKEGDLFVVRNQQGHINVKELPPLKIPIDMINIERLNVHWEDKGAATQDQELFSIPSLLIKQDRKSDSGSWSLQLDSPGCKEGTISMTGTFSPALIGTGKLLEKCSGEYMLEGFTPGDFITGAVRTEDKGITIPAAWADSVPAGAISLRGTFEGGPAGIISRGSLACRFNGISRQQWTTAKHIKPSQPAEIALQFDLEYQKTDKMLLIRRADITGPGFKSRLKGRLSSDDTENTGINIYFTDGYLQPDNFRQGLVFMGAGQSGLYDFTSSQGGALRFQGHLSGNHNGMRLSLSLDGKDWTIKNKLLHKLGGQACTLELKGGIDTSNKVLAIDKLNWSWKNTHGNLQLRIPGWERRLSEIYQANRAQNRKEALLNLLDTWTKQHYIQQLQGNFQADKQGKYQLNTGPYKLLVAGRFGIKFNLVGGSPNTNYLAAAFERGTRVTLLKETTSSPTVLFEKIPAEPLSLNINRQKVMSSRDDGMTLLLTSNNAYAQLDCSNLDYRSLISREGIFVLDGAWKIGRMEQWLAMLPASAAMLRKNRIHLSGDSTGQLEMKLLPGTSFDIKTKLDLGSSEIILQNRGPKANYTTTDRQTVFAKRKNKPLHLELQAESNIANGNISLKGTAVLPSFDVYCQAKLTKKLNLWNTTETRAIRSLHLAVRSEHLEQLPVLMPSLFTNHRLQFGDWHIEELTGKGELSFNSDKQDTGANYAITADLTDSSFRWQYRRRGQDTAGASGINPPGVNGIKPGGQPLRLKGEISFRQGASPWGKLFPLLQPLTAPLLLQVKQLYFQAGDCTVKASGEMICASQNTRLTGPEADKNFWTVWQNQFPSGSLSLQGELDFQDDWVQKMIVSTVLREGVLPAGQSRLKGQLVWDRNSRKWRSKGTLDLTATSLQINSAPTESKVFCKPAGDRLICRFEADNTGKINSIRFKQLQLDLPEAVLNCEGILQLRQATAPNGGISFLPENMELTGRLQAGDLAKFHSWYPPLAGWVVKGRVDLAVQGAVQFYPALAVEPRDLQFTGAIGGIWHNKPFASRFNDIHVTERKLIIPRLTIQAGQSDITIVADLQHGNLANYNNSRISRQVLLQGRIEILSDNINGDELLDLLTTDMSNSGYRLPADTLKNIIQNVQLQCSGDFSNVLYTDSKTTAHIHARQVRANGSIDKGVVKAIYITAVNGGVVNGMLQCDLNIPHPVVAQKCIARDLQVDETLRPLVVSEFPDMEVYGTVSEQKELYILLDDLLQSTGDWAGSGTTECKSGVLFGPGGPDWILRLLPVLKLVEYDWNKNSINYQRFRDGSKKNHILFAGRQFNIYIDGTTTPVRDAQELDGIPAKLQQDLRTARTKLAKWQQKRGKVDGKKLRWLRRRVQGLSELVKIFQHQRKPPIGRADYLVGTVVIGGSRQRFVKPREFLRIPLFRIRGYIIGQYMIDLQTTNSPF